MIDDDVKTVTGCFLFILAMLAIVPLYLLNSWMLWCAYHWAVLPAFESLPVLSYKQVLCLYIFKSIATHKSVPNSDKDKSLLETMYDAWIATIIITLLELVALLVLYIIH